MSILHSYGPVEGGQDPLCAGSNSEVEGEKARNEANRDAGF